MRIKISLVLFCVFLCCPLARANEWDGYLLDAVDRKDVAAVQKLIRLGADVNARDALGFPVLMTAARRGVIDVVQLLVNNGAYVDLEAQDPFFVDFSGATALMWAAEDGHLEIAQYLLEKGADVDFWSETFIPTALLRAALNGQDEMVKLLLDYGAYVDQSVNGKTALFFAALEGNAKVVRVLLDYGADINARQRQLIWGDWGRNGQEKFMYSSTILMQAAKKGDMEIMHLLLDQGADVNALDACGVSALMFTTKRGHADVARLLISRGADINVRAIKQPGNSEAFCGTFPGTTALILAARDSHATDIARMLLSKGAHVDVADSRGWTALMHACENGYTDMVRLFISKGAKVNIKSGPYTPLYLAESHDYQEIVNLLLKAGAKKTK